jgi:hypothetical protein
VVSVPVVVPVVVLALKNPIDSFVGLNAGVIYFDAFLVVFLGIPLNEPISRRSFKEYFFLFLLFLVPLTFIVLSILSAIYIVNGLISLIVLNILEVAFCYSVCGMGTLFCF